MVDFIINSGDLVLWLPIIIISSLSILKIINKNHGQKKPWFRIEDIKDNE